MQHSRPSRQFWVLTAVGTLVLLSAVAGTVWFSRDQERAPHPRLVLLGLDGLDWAFLDPRIARGSLPNFARLRREGRTGLLESLRPLLSPLLWTSIATGVGPDKHGVLDFLEIDAHGKAVPITSRSRRSLAFWDLARGWNRSVGVVNWFGTWPAESVPGWVVSDRVSYHSFFFAKPEQASTGMTYPPELFAELGPLLVSDEAIRPGELAPYFGDFQGVVARARADRVMARQLEQFRHLLAAARTYEAVTLDLMRSRPVDLLAVYLDSFDTACHLYAPFIPPRQEWIDPGLFNEYSPAVDRVVEDLDAFLGKLLDQLPADTRLLVVSDHGFRTSTDRLRGGSNIDEAMAAEWHRPQGMVALFGHGVPAGRIDSMTVLDVLPSVCALLAEPPAQGFEGRPPREIAELAPPLQAVALDLNREPPAVDEEDQAAPEVTERLEALGYIGSGPKDAGRFRASYYNNLGVYFHKVKKDYQQAQAMLRKAMELDPNDLQSSANLAGVYLAQKQFDVALPLLQDVVARAPELLNARVNLAICYRVLNREADAERELRAALELDNAIEPAWWNLGLAQEKAGEFEDAAASYEKAAALNSESDRIAVAHNAAGLMHAQAGQMDKARSEFQAATVADAGALDPRINLANVLAIQGDSAGARKLFGEVLLRDADNVKALNGLGQLDLRAGDVASARERLGRSLQLSPDQPNIRQLVASMPVAQH